MLCPRVASLNPGGTRVVLSERHRIRSSREAGSFIGYFPQSVDGEGTTASDAPV